MITGKILTLIASLLSRVGISEILSWVIGMVVIFISILTLGALSTYIVPGYEPEVTVLIMLLYFLDIMLAWIGSGKD